MDSITQIAIGIATVEAVAGKELKNKSFLVGAILGTLPDLDVWIGKLFSYETEVLFHRSFTHSILGIIILSPILAWICRRIWRQFSFKKWNVIIASTFATHILIDLFTSWGVQLFYPFESRISFKTIFVVDFFYTIPWIITLILLFRKTDHNDRKRILKRGFIITTSYLALTVAIKLFVLAKVNAFADEQKMSSNFTIKPTFSNCILWNITFKEQNFIRTSSYSLFDTQPLAIEQSILIDEKLQQQFKDHRQVQQLVEASEGWYFLERVNDSTYHFNDFRFGSFTNADGKLQYVFAYEIKQRGMETMIQPLPKQLRDGKGTLIKTLDRLKGN